MDEMTKWVRVGLDSGVAWPTAETRVHFEGHEILLQPETDQLAPSVVLGYKPPMREEEAYHLLRRFLSSLSWVEGGLLREIGATGGSHPFGVGKGPMAHLVSRNFRVDYLPEPADPKERLALALYREALGLNSAPYQFLGFYKIVNIFHNEGPAQKAWINSTLDKLEDNRALNRVEELRQQVENVGNYLYESGRCAVAHAFSEPIVDPDDPEDTRRLEKDLPVMKALAEYAVEHELGIRSKRTIYREHLYELEGFRGLLGDIVINALKSKQALSLEMIPSLPRLSVRLRDYPPFAALENLRAEPVDVVNGRLFLRCVSDDGLLEAVLGLNFAEECLEFDPEDSIAVFDDGSVLPVQKALDYVRFFRGLYSNGEVEVWESEREVLLGRCAPFIPEYVDFRATDENFEGTVDTLSAEIERRRQESGGSAPAAE